MSCVPQIVASGRLAFGRFTLSREGLSALLWLANMATFPVSPPPPPTSQPPVEITRPRDDGHSRRRLRGLRVSYAVSFEVDRTGVVLVLGGENAGDAASPQQVPPLCSRGNRRRNGASKAAAAPSEPVRSSSAPSFRFRRHSSPLGAAAAAPGDSSDANRSATAHHRAANLIRLTIPRVGIRACSAPLPTATARRGDISDRRKEVEAASGGGEGVGRPGTYGLAVTVTAESLEGHLEMDDPGTATVPTFFPPLHEAKERRDGSGVGTPPSSTRRSTSPPDVSSGNRTSAGDVSVVDEPQSSSSSVGSSSCSSAETPAMLLRETHCLRWLVIRNVSFRAGTAQLVDAENVARKVPASADKVSGGRRGGSGSALQFLSGKEEDVGGEGLSVDGLWAEWSPVLFFLAGTSGAMVRMCTILRA